MVKSKCSKAFWGIIILIFGVTFATVNTFAICSFDFHEGEHAGGNHHPYFHCGVELNDFVPSENLSSSLGDLTSCWGISPQITEPQLPILSFSILKIPRPA
jgi:hypothetical protein